MGGIRRAQLVLDPRFLLALGLERQVEAPAACVTSPILFLTFSVLSPGLTMFLMAVPWLSFFRPAAAPSVLSLCASLSLSLPLS